MGIGGGDGKADERGGVDCCRRLQCGPREDGYMRMGQRDCNSVGYGSTRRSCGSLPPGTAGLEKKPEDMGNGEAREVSAVLNGLHPGIRPPDLSEHGRLGNEAQL